MKNKVLLLTKIMLKSEDAMGLSMEGTSSSKKRKGQGILKILGLAALILLLVASFIPITFDLYRTMGRPSDISVLVRLLLYMGSLLSFVFGFFYVLSLFYFSSDIENYLILPVKPGDIVLAKLLTVVIYEIATTFLLILPNLITLGVISKQGWAFYPKAVLACILIPLVPLAFMSILAMILMRFSKVFTNKDRFTTISSLLGVFMAIGISQVFNQLGQRSSSGQLPDLILGKGTFYNILAVVFPAAVFMQKAVTGDLAAFLINTLITLVISALAMFLAYLVGNALYFDGAKGLNESGSKRQALTAEELSRETKPRSPILAIAAKEMKTLLRTPAFFINNILISLIFPIFFFIPVLTQSEVREMLAGFLTSDHSALWLSVPPEMIIIVASAIVTLYAGLNAISVTAVTREGANFSHMKIIPVSYLKQLLAKMLPALLVQTVGVLIILVPILIILRPPLVPTLLGLLLGYIMSFAMNLAMLMLDTSNPNLNWTSEQKAVKQSFNSFISTFLSFPIAGLPVILMLVTDWDLRIIIGVLFLVGSVLSLVLLFLLPKVADRSFANRP